MYFILLWISHHKSLECCDTENEKSKIYAENAARPNRNAYV